MSAIIKLIRPINCLMGIVGVLVGGIIGVGLEIFSSDYIFEITLGMIIAFFFMAAGNLMNDYFDAELDKINHPNRPIPAGDFQAKDVIIAAGSIYGLLLVLGLLINLYMLIILIIALILMIGYEISLKRRGLIGNITISILVAFLFIFGAAAVAKFGVVIFLALLAFLATLAREIIKDIEDISGDIDRATLPKQIGIKNAGYLAGIVLGIAILLSTIPVFTEVLNFVELSNLSIYYLYLIVPADILFIISITNSSSSPTLAQNTLKAGMVIALVAFILGSVA